MDPEHFDPSDLREWRRMRAWHLKQLGWKQRQIAVALGVREGTVSRWIARARRDGPAALLSHLAHGRPAKLRPDQRRLIPDFLSHGAEAYGFRGEVWTCAVAIAVWPRSSRKSSASPITRATSLGS